MRCALVALICAFSAACSCGGKSPGPTPDAGTQPDGGKADGGGCPSSACAIGTDTACATDGTLVTCTADSKGCGVFPAGGGTSCGTHAACTGTAPTATCVCNADPNGCTQAGTICDSSGGLVTCALDANNCPYTVSSDVCPTNQTCVAGATACSCVADPNCSAGAGTYCYQNNTIYDCAADTNGCVVSATPTSCSSNQTCTGAGGAAVCQCNDTCTAGDVASGGTTGTFCDTNGNLATCTFGSDGCYVASNAAPCGGSQTCQGSGGAAACACPSAAGTPVAGAGCSTLGATACDGASILTCASSGGCDVWTITTDCSATGLVCGTQAGGPSCECPANTTRDFYADPVNGSAAGAAPFPTGVASPAGCRFAKLGDALAWANAYVTPSTPTARAIASGFVSGGAAVVFSSETMPLVVNTGVTVTTDEDPNVSPFANFNPADYHVDYWSGSVMAAFQLADGATLSGYTIVNTAAPNGGEGVTFNCASSTPAHLTSLAVDGLGVSATSLGNDVHVGSPCTVYTQNLVLSGASGNGLWVDAASTVFSTGDDYSGNGTGVYVGDGSWTAGSVTVEKSGGTGVLEIPSSNSASASMTITNSLIAQNQAEGVVMYGTGSLGNVANITGTEVASNGKNGNKAGVLDLSGALTIEGDNIHANYGPGLVAGGTGETLPVTVTSQNVTVHFDANGVGAASPGIVVDAGAALTLLQPTISQNLGEGLHLYGGASTATLHGATVDANILQGVIEDAGTLVIDQTSAVTNNGQGNTKAAGVRVNGGTFTLDGSSVNGNGTAGVNIAAPAAATVNSSTFNTNGTAGLAINDSGTGAKPINITTNSFTNNGNANVWIAASGAFGAASQISVALSSNTMVGAAQGIFVGSTLCGATGNQPCDVWAIVDSNDVSGATATGMVVESTATSALQLSNNNVHQNKSAAAGSTGRAVGGLVIYGAQPATAGRWTYQGNEVHDNDGDQVAVLGTGATPTSWDLSAASCTVASSYHCYNHLATPSTWVGLVAYNANVNAQFTHWAGSGGTSDATTVSIATIDTTNSCSPVPTCP